MNTYDFEHDFLHTTGYPDYDMEYELPDPISSMHFKRKRSPIAGMVCGVIMVAVFLGYFSFGAKMPQKDNPFYWRKKYGTPTTLSQFINVAQMEYGDSVMAPPDRNVMITNKGFEFANSGVRIDFDSYDDLIC